MGLFSTKVGSLGLSALHIPRQSGSFRMRLPKMIQHVLCLLILVTSALAFFCLYLEVFHLRRGFSIPSTTILSSLGRFDR